MPTSLSSNIYKCVLMNINNKKRIISITKFLTIFFVGMFLGITCFIFLISVHENFSTSNPQKYNKAIKAIERQEKIYHFPKKIPFNAEDIQFYCYTDSFNGEVMLLKFKIDKKFILKELKTYKFINQDTKLGTKQKIYFMPSDKNRIISDNYTFYVIDDQENREYYKQYFPYFSGIGVSPDLKYILYYYINPKD